ncbi:NADH-quinone oxidoreductase subunit NuoB [Acidiphilium sp. AL]|uniref:NADH-quinone oxidoreductase subunit NuoB n=1 Tax=Acidiphilium iwatense TaxID=768198 RepID=A0ABS9DTQ2_9PROT|nr:MULTISPECIES: NADH-quinone oxidoreductase subunit NuoB [Acidiphilium]MCF3946110.1 NADH-quinone oxidoreductase subunit NuoB [Acidiphilium iwatense]MCU4160980.1 NADH-quinone oxidoreductase subunit NuoB [Acidiphilium sp. AL]
MALWTLIGLAEGQATTRWPLGEGPDGQAGGLGMPRLDAAQCADGCADCAAACPTGAIALASAQNPVLDYGKCVVCQRCVEVCPTGALSESHDWAFGVRNRADLITAPAEPAAHPAAPSRRGFRRSLHVRHVDAGSCNGCESELQALNNPFYNLHRLGIFFTPSPRFADLLLVTGPVTKAMLEPLLRTYKAMPEPRWVMASGSCAVSGGIAPDGPCLNGLDAVLPVDLYLPGCPPNPAALIEALLLFLDRMPQRVHQGRIDGE